MANVTQLGAKYLRPMHILKVLGLIYWVRDLATKNICKVHVDRLKHEENVQVHESENIRSLFPVDNYETSQECVQVR